MSVRAILALDWSKAQPRRAGEPGVRVLACVDYKSRSDERGKIFKDLRDAVSMRIRARKRKFQRQSAAALVVAACGRTYHMNSLLLDVIAMET